MIVLGIETSCDETAAAVVQDGRVLLSNVVASSMDLHIAYGGVVPEIAARSHIESIMPVIDQAVQEAHKSHESRVMGHGLAAEEQLADPWSIIDAIAVTQGAGLGGSLLVGVMTARTLAIVKNKPLYGVNHVHGHVAANFITESHESRVTSHERAAFGYILPDRQPEFPMLALIVSGGHTQLVFFRDHFDYELLGRTRDDAIGEAFDKVAKIIGLPYPGGPSVAAAAEKGDPHAYAFPKARLSEVGAPGSRPLAHSPTPLTNYDFSFSGLKTAVLRTAQASIGEDFTFPSFRIAERLTERQRADIAASFQCVAIETVVDKTMAAVREFAPKSVVLAGGVAANQELRRQLAVRLKSQESAPSTFNLQPSTFVNTDIKLCTDNGAMIAALGCFHVQAGLSPADPYSVDIRPNLSM